MCTDVDLRKVIHARCEFMNCPFACRRHLELVGKIRYCWNDIVYAARKNICYIETRLRWRCSVFIEQFNHVICFLSNLSSCVERRLFHSHCTNLFDSELQPLDHVQIEILQHGAERSDRRHSTQSFSFYYITQKFTASAWWDPESSNHLHQAYCKSASYLWFNPHNSSSRGSCAHAPDPHIIN